MIRSLLHPLRDSVLRVAAQRPFHPVGSPENVIVLVRPDHFGDLLLLSPAVHYLQQAIKDHEIILMTGPWNQSVAAHIFPDVTCLTFPFPGFDRDAGSTFSLEPYREIKRAADELRKLCPRAIVLFRDDHWWGAAMAREAGIPLRAGYDHPQVAPFLTHPVSLTVQNYAAQNLELSRRAVALLGDEFPPVEMTSSYPLTWPSNEPASTQARELLERNGVTGDFVIIHPGTGAPVKTWPVRRWAAVADEIARRAGLQVVLSGANEERSLCNQIQMHASARLINIAGATSLMSLGEIFRSARMVLGVDSGPLHLAVATETRSIHLYGPSDHIRYGPYGNPEMHRVVRAGMTCPSCGDLSQGRAACCGCMTAITTGEVAQLACEMLNEQ
jgi:heptosyltransferase III